MTIKLTLYIDLDALTRKIDTIKRIRRMTGGGLTEIKNMVEKYAGYPVDLLVHDSRGAIILDEMHDSENTLVHVRAAKLISPPSVNFDFSNEEAYAVR